ncbi:MAG: extracellular solute-binding protein [Candidatus Buchananbacteria bacterium]
MKKNLKIKITTLVLLALAVITSGFQCKWISPATQAMLEPIELTWWSVYDDPQDIDELVADYKVIHPNIKVTYRKLRPEEFKTELINALAEDRGPDIFTIHNTWVTEQLSKLEPLPAKIKMAYQVTKKSLGIKEETLIEVREEASITPAQLKEGFLDVVASDVVRDGKVYGLPLSVDTLVLFYNRDLLNNAGIPLPPNNWIELQENVKKLTYQDKDGNLVQSGVALGTADNIDRYSDILSLLMMQNGAQMVTNNQVSFGSVPRSFPDQTYNPGPEAVRFYTDFANTSKEVYTWNETIPNSINAFAQGRVAMIFGYNYHLATLDAVSQGRLNYGIAKMPQIEGRPEVNFANYWLQVVSKKSKHKNEAWDFIQFISKSAEAKKYLTKTLKPTALRSLVSEQKNNDQLRPFAEQLLTSKSWYQGNNVGALESAFKEMIDSVRKGGELRDAIGLAIQKIQQTL